MVRQNTLSGAFLALTISVGCSEDSPGMQILTVENEEVVFENVIDIDSPTWLEAPFTHEIENACPLPSVPLQPMGYEATVFRNEGSVSSFTVSLEGQSFDSALSAEPLLLVYAGESLPRGEDATRDCLGIADPGGGNAGTVVVSAAPGESFIVIALEPTLITGISSPAEGTYRLRVSPD